MLSVRPKIAELVFQLYGRSLHPELFVVHREQQIARGDYQATLQITNTGHVVCWRYGGLFLTEVATSANQPLPDKRQLMSHPIGGERRDRVECRGGVEYKTSFSLERVTAETFLTFQQEIKLAGAQQGLLHEFNSSGRLSLGAMSYIYAEARDRSLLLQALHTFPDDYAILKSESTFSLP